TDLQCPVRGSLGRVEERVACQPAVFRETVRRSAFHFAPDSVRGGDRCHARVRGAFVPAARTPRRGRAHGSGARVAGLVWDGRGGGGNVEGGCGPGSGFTN